MHEYTVIGGWRPMDNKDLFTALSAAQGKVENAKKLSKNPHFKSNYADLATIWDVIRDTFAEEGLSVLQLPCEAPAGYVGLTTTVAHKSGQYVQERYFLALKDASNPQQAGSAFTYMKRYALLGVAGIASEDDDGNAATGRPAPVAANPGVDYAPARAEALTKLAAADDAEARRLYATVRNSVMPDTVKNALLLEMSEIIKARIATTAVEAKKEKKK